MDLRIAPDKICRVCLKKSEQLKSLCAKTEDNELNLLESLHFVVNIKISMENLLPNQICNNCETALCSAEAFKLRCLNSEMILTEQFHLNNQSEILDELSKTPVKIKREHHKIATSGEYTPDKPSSIPNTSKQKYQPERFSVIPMTGADSNFLDENLVEPLFLTTNVKFESNSESDGLYEVPLKLSSTFTCKKETVYLPQTDIDANLLQRKNLRSKRPIQISNRPIGKKKVVARKEKMTDKVLINDSIKEFDGDEKETNNDNNLDTETLENKPGMATPKNICPTCKKEFKLASQLKNHIIKVHVRGNSKNLDYECEVCKASFPQLWLLNKHMKFHSEDAFTHLCPECGKKLRNKYYLEEHMMRHKGVKPFQCDQCDNSFVTKMELIMHKRRHNGEMPFSCEHCGRKFRAYSSLVRHRRTHTGERPYKCDMCPKSFAESGTRNEHRRIHTGEKPFQCKLCDQKFTKRHHLKTHLKTHLSHYGEPSKKQNK